MPCSPPTIHHRQHSSAQCHAVKASPSQLCDSQVMVFFIHAPRPPSTFERKSSLLGRQPGACSSPMNYEYLNLEDVKDKDVLQQWKERWKILAWGSKPLWNVTYLVDCLCIQKCEHQVDGHFFYKNFLLLSSGLCIDGSKQRSATNPNFLARERERERKSQRLLFALFFNLLKWNRSFRCGLKGNWSIEFVWNGFVVEIISLTLITHILCDSVELILSFQ